MNRGLDAVVGGWSISSLISEQSGQPLASPRLQDGNQRPNVACGGGMGISSGKAAGTQTPFLKRQLFR